MNIITNTLLSRFTTTQFVEVTRKTFKNDSMTLRCRYKKETVSVLSSLNSSRCQTDLICTTPLFDGGSICSHDDGGPLFQSECGLSHPSCVYGVASFAKDLSPLLKCSQGSYFSSVVFHYDWLVSVMSNRMWS